MGYGPGHGSVYTPNEMVIIREDENYTLNLVDISCYSIVVPFLIRSAQLIVKCLD